jgi:hypothetical protein
VESGDAFVLTGACVDLQGFQAKHRVLEGAKRGYQLVNAGGLVASGHVRFASAARTIFGSMCTAPSPATRATPNEAHVVSHLLVATDALTKGHRTGTYVAVCGELVSATSAQPRPPGCERDYEALHCPACVHAAAHWNAGVSGAV